MDKAKKKLNTAEVVLALAAPLAEELGLTLWDVTFQKEGSDWYLRIFIDRDTGISIDDCVDMTQAVNPVLDKEDPIQQEYTLEVSSPGLNRKLVRPEHFTRYMGEMVRVKLIRPMQNGEKILDGILLKADENGAVELQVDEETTALTEKKEYSSVVLLEDDFA
ncbi:ribosome maturation factor RimP [Scatolibacter rhodanostii]|uniref:ribosome maturation factor RimP n=1 Tax=Scatolibacter rhodanostii TaxID=2014781 RepID=UPI000C068B8B|nr:ribosome maturation factor RimP [Scatolibacter rhodanostii]